LRLPYTSEPPLFFGGYRPPRDRSIYSVVGVPFDSTTSYRTGQRDAPAEIRRASAQIEFYSIHSDIDAESIPVYDEGDILVVPGDVHETIKRLAEVVELIRRDNRIPIILGGEHTISLGSLRGLASERPCIVVFDAHFDLRDEYQGSRYTHASVFRRVVELLRPERLVYIGVRAFSIDEKEFAEEASFISFYTTMNLAKLGEVNVCSLVKKDLRLCRRVYVSIDMDVLDPAYAPGVGNPEPGGISSWSLFELINCIVDNRLVGFDVVEVTPVYDPSEITAVTAAKVVVEVVATHYRSASTKIPK